MIVPLEKIKQLRARTGAGVVDVQEALTASGGNEEKAILWLREKGKASAAKRVSRTTGEGCIGSYVHNNNKIAVLVELRCETDFVARNDKFLELSRNLAMHIAAMDPMVVNPDDMSGDDLAQERDLARKSVERDGKPPALHEKIIEGKLKKFKEERALLTQTYVKDPRKTVGELIAAVEQELGERINVKEFSRIEI